LSFLAAARVPNAALKLGASWSDVVGLSWTARGILEGLVVGHLVAVGAELTRLGIGKGLVRIAFEGDLLRFWDEHAGWTTDMAPISHAEGNSQKALYRYERMPYTLLATLGFMGVLLAGMSVGGCSLSPAPAHRRVQAASPFGGGVPFLTASLTNSMVLTFVSMSLSLASFLSSWGDMERRRTRMPRMHGPHSRSAPVAPSSPPAGVATPSARTGVISRLVAAVKSQGRGKRNDGAR
jgi:hypothetical protein